MLKPRPTKRFLFSKAMKSYIMILQALCLLPLAWAQSCQSCQDSDELQLLQLRSDDKQIPGLDKLGDAMGKVMGAAHEIGNQGLGQVTIKILDALERADKQIQDAGLKLNKSVESFQRSADAAETLSQNLTKMQKLVSDTMEDLVPSYKTTLEQIQVAVKSTKSILSAMGQKDLLDKLDGCESTAVDHLSSLADKTQAIATNMADATEKELEKSLKTMDSLLDKAVEAVKSFRMDFDLNLKYFTQSLMDPLSIALGDEAPQKIGNLTVKADGVMADLQSLVMNVSQALQSCGTMVDSKLEEVGQEGFFRKIFKSIFGWKEQKTLW